MDEKEYSFITGNITIALIGTIFICAVYGQIFYAQIGAVLTGLFLAVKIKYGERYKEVKQ